MSRILMTSFMLAASIVVLTSQSNAQSPDPALLATGQSGRMLAQPRYHASRPSYASAGHRNVFGSYRSLTGARGGSLQRYDNAQRVRSVPDPLHGRT
jgi:hypothetical protein